MDVAVPADHKEKIKENKTISKYLDLALERRKYWNMEGMVIPIVTDAIVTAPKSLEKGLEELTISGRIDSIQTTLLIRSARILRRNLET